VDRIDRVSRKYSLLTNVDKTKVMASDGIACRILIQVELYSGDLQRTGTNGESTSTMWPTLGDRGRLTNSTGHLCVQHDG